MAYTTISITAPSTAKKGATVNASVTVKNTTQYNYSFRGDIYALPDKYPEYVIGSINQVIMAGASKTVNVSFTMPDCAVTIFLWLERWATSAWVYDNSASKVVSLEVVTYTGSLSKKELEYDSVRGTIPVSNVPQDKRGLVHIWGRNNMASSQKLGISWIVKNPTGLTVESYSDWQSGSASPGDTHEFIGGRFDINKTGTWTIAIGLFMNPSAPVQVASYNGALCTVPVTQYKGSIAKKELEYDSVRGTIPVY